jgi:hypothetical protein
LREAEKEADKLRQEVTAVDEENEAMRMKLNVSKRTSDHPARSREVLERMKALQDKSYATEVAMGLAQQEAEKRVQAAERETFSVRKELEDRIFGKDLLVKRTHGTCKEAHAHTHTRTDQTARLHITDTRLIAFRCSATGD